MPGQRRWVTIESGDVNPEICMTARIFLGRFLILSRKKKEEWNCFEKDTTFIEGKFSQWELFLRSHNLQSRGSKESNIFHA
jgi:hypothetical protein